MTNRAPSVAAFLDDHDITQAELRRALGMSAAKLSRKVNGHRGWSVSEVQALLSFLRERCKKPRLAFDDLFGRAA
jgi:hypothetical protein